MRIKLDTNTTPVVNDGDISVHIGKSSASVIDDYYGEKTTITSFEDMLNKSVNAIAGSSSTDKVVQASELSVEELTKLYLKLGITSVSGEKAESDTGQMVWPDSSVSNNTASVTSSGSTAKLPFTVPEDLKPVFQKAAEKYNIDYNILVSVAYAESNFHSGSTSKSGAMGIMQLMPATAKYLGVKDAYDPEQNIMGGARYLAEKFNQHGSVKLGLAAYNAGSNAVKKYNGVPPYNETQNYVKKILGCIGTDGSESGFVSSKDYDYTAASVYGTQEDGAGQADKKKPDDIPADTVIRVGDVSMDYSAYLKYVELLQ